MIRFFEQQPKLRIDPALLPISSSSGLINELGKSRAALSECSEAAAIDSSSRAARGDL
jgi:hypothetical protein